MSEIAEETVIETQRIYEGRILNLRIDTIRLPDGKTAKREVVEHGGAVAMVPLLDPETVVMVRQYRRPTGQYLLEVPAGGIERGEDPVDCVQRELSEEIGFRADHVIKLFQAYVAPGYTSELIHTFLAFGLKPAVGTADEDEFIDIVKVKLADVPDMIARAEIQDGKSIGGLLATLRILPTLKFDREAAPDVA